MTTITFDKTDSINYIDSKSKSVVSGPTVVGKDLEGCGADTHAAYNFSMNLNENVQCNSIVPLISFSESSKTILTPPSGVSAVGAGMLVPSLFEYILTNDIQAVATFIGITTADFEDNGVAYVHNGFNSTGYNVIIQKRTFIQDDQPCGISIINNFKSSVIWTAKDPDTCEIKLIETSSVSYRRVNNYKGITPSFTIPPGGIGMIEALKIDQMNPLIDDLPAAQLADAVQRANTQYFNQTLTV